jgi:hypothetical protein
MAATVARRGVFLSVGKLFRENFAKSPLRFFVPGVYSYLSLVITATTTIADRFRAESQKRKRK